MIVLLLVPFLTCPPGSGVLGAFKEALVNQHILSYLEYLITRLKHGNVLRSTWNHVVNATGQSGSGGAD